jgi:hypothetical protein
MPRKGHHAMLHFVLDSRLPVVMGRRQGLQNILPLRLLQDFGLVQSMRLSSASCGIFGLGFAPKT